MIEDYKVGKGKPPKEHQFKPGTSGNPAGAPKRKAQFWTYLCKYLDMTDAEIKRLDISKLTQGAQLALKTIEDAKKGGSNLQRLIEYCVNRDEGRPEQAHRLDVEPRPGLNPVIIDFSNLSREKDKTALPEAKDVMFEEDQSN